MCQHEEPPKKTNFASLILTGGPPVEEPAPSLCSWRPFADLPNTLASHECEMQRLSNNQERESLRLKCKDLANENLVHGHLHLNHYFLIKGVVFPLFK